MNHSSTHHSLKTFVRRAAAVVAALALVVVAIPAAAAASGRVNVNTADADQLELLPRVGPAIAGRILEFRDENGDFAAAEDLMLVRGIGEKTFELIEPYVTLDGETTLTEKVSASRAAAEREDGGES
ncbi:MAG TPA: helix-hairpin-helix domain-containing protein [Thermoanaerobaculia bacterium]|nr:helix-hairpin-helix domain-containing protein [Thermoanaerobaculia bacterium]